MPDSNAYSGFLHDILESTVAAEDYLARFPLPPSSSPPNASSTSSSSQAEDLDAEDIEEHEFLRTHFGHADANEQQDVQVEIEDEDTHIRQQTRKQKADELGQLWTRLNAIQLQDEQEGSEHMEEEDPHRAAAGLKSSSHTSTSDQRTLTRHEREEVRLAMSASRLIQQQVPDHMKFALRTTQRWSTYCEKVEQNFYEKVTTGQYTQKLLEDPRLQDRSDGADWFLEGLNSLSAMGFELLPSQYEFVRICFNIAIPHIYKKDFAKYKVKLLTQMRREGFQRMAVLACPRQHGKSFTVSAATAALLLIGRGLNIVVVAQVQDIASQLMTDAVNNLAKIAPHRIIFQNKKKCYISSADVPPGTSRKEIIQKGWFNTVRAFSSNATGARGNRASVIIMDEAAFIKPKMIHEIIAPLMRVKHTVVIALSTSQGEDNWLSHVMVRKDEIAKRNVIVQQIKAVCEQCEVYGVEKCNHRGDLPPWQDEGANEIVQILMGGDKKLFRQEILGQIVSSTHNNLFLPKYVDYLFKQKKYPIRYLPQPRMCITFIDPKGKSKNQSYFAVVTVILTPDDGMLLVGIDEIPDCIYLEKKKFLMHYFTNLSNHPIFEHSAHIIVIEQNFGAEAQFIYPYLAKQILQQKNPYCVVIPYNATPESDGGEWTGSVTKLNGASDLVEMLTNKKVYLVDDLVVAHVSKREIVQEECISQMKQMRVQRSAKGNLQVDGKLNSNTHDDMAMSLILVTSVAKKYQAQMAWRENRIQSADNNPIRQETLVF